MLDATVHPESSLTSRTVTASPAAAAPHIRRMTLSTAARSQATRDIYEDLWCGSKHLLGTESPTETCEFIDALLATHYPEESSRPSDACTAELKKCPATIKHYFDGLSLPVIRALIHSIETEGLFVAKIPVLLTMLYNKGMLSACALTRSPPPLLSAPGRRLDDVESKGESAFDSGALSTEALQHVHVTMQAQLKGYHTSAHTSEMASDITATLASMGFSRSDQALAEFAAVFHDFIQTEKIPTKNEERSFDQAVAVLRKAHYSAPLNKQLHCMIMGTVMHMHDNLFSQLSVIYARTCEAIAHAQGEHWEMTPTDVMMLVISFLDIHRYAFAPIIAKAHLRTHVNIASIHATLLSFPELTDGNKPPALDARRVEAFLGLIGQNIRMMVDANPDEHIKRQLLALLKKAGDAASFEELILSDAEYCFLHALLLKKLGGEQFFAGAQRIDAYLPFFARVPLPNGQILAELIDVTLWQRHAQILQHLSLLLPTFATTIVRGHCFWRRNITVIHDNGKNLLRVCVMAAAHHEGAYLVKANAALAALDLAAAAKEDSSVCHCFGR